MKLSNFVAGLNILLPYYDDPDDVNIQFEYYGYLYLCPTSRHMSDEDVHKMRDLGWFQEENENVDMYDDPYRQDKYWCADV